MHIPKLCKKTDEVKQLPVSALESRTGNYPQAPLKSSQLVPDVPASSQLPLPFLSSSSQGLLASASLLFTRTSSSNAKNDEVVVSRPCLFFSSSLWHARPFVQMQIALSLLLFFCFTHRMQIVAFCVSFPDVGRWSGVRLSACPCIEVGVNSEARQWLW